jgi:signal peptidase I
LFGKRRSYAETVQGRRKATRRLGVLFLVFICYESLTGLFLATYVMKSQAMSPTVLPGDRIIVTPLAFGPRTLFGKLPGIARPERGEIVVVEPNYTKRFGFWELLSDSFVRFVTFQLVSPARNGPARFEPDGILSAPTLQRVIGLPGDTIQMDDFEFKIKSAGSDQFLTEFEFSSMKYDISHEDAPKSWRADLPGSGHMDARVLGEDEYFLAGDPALHRAIQGFGGLYASIAFVRRPCCDIGLPRGLAVLDRSSR